MLFLFVVYCWFRKKKDEHLLVDYFEHSASFRVAESTGSQGYISVADTRFMNEKTDEATGLIWQGQMPKVLAKVLAKTKG